MKMSKELKWLPMKCRLKGGVGRNGILLILTIRFIELFYTLKYIHL